MSKIDEMLKNERVEWKRLGEVFEIRNGYTPSKRNKEFWEGGNIPWFRMEDLREQGKIVIDSKQHITEKAIRGKGLFKANSIILATTATIGEHAMLIADSLANQRFTNFSICKSLECSLLPKYVFYYFDIIDEWCKKNTKVSSFPAVNMDMLLELDFPIPSLETQQKIVKTLDKFTNYVTELQAELQYRIKQYEYYRDMLLSEEYLNKLSEKIYSSENNRKITFCRIKDVCNRQKGINITAKKMKELNNENKPVRIFAGGNTIANVAIDVVGENNIINMPSVIVKSRGNIDFEYYDKPFSHKNEMWSYSTINDEVLNIKFLFYLLKNNLKYFRDNSISGKLPQISTGVTDNYKIPIIPLEIQNKVVEILDKFQSLLSDTKGLLPKEIALRQKQYEYYREKLLDFKKD